MDLQPNKELDPAMVDFLNRKTGMILLVAGLGKYSGSVLCRSLAGKLQQQQQQQQEINRNSLVCLVIAPFEFEGSKAGKIAQKVSDFLFSRNLDPPILLEEVRVLHGNLAVRSAFKKGDDMMMARFLELMESEKRL